MNEIEKLYENAHLHKCLNIGNFCKYIGATCERCKKHKYPPFTAEKQIEIIKKLWKFRPNIYPNFDLLVNHSFGEMIATFVNNLWQDLTDTEKEQIKEILNE